MPSGSSDSHELDRHLQLSFFHSRILNLSKFVLHERRRHDSVDPQHKAGQEDNVVEDDFLHQADDFAEREDDVNSLVAFTEALYAIDFAPADERVDLDGEQVEYEQGAVEHLAI